MVHLHLTRVRICREAKVDPTAEVLDARAAGATWSQIAAACGRTKQAVAVRWGAAAAEDARQRQESAEERTRPEVSPLDQFDPTGVELPAPQATTPAQRTGQ